MNKQLISYLKRLKQHGLKHDIPNVTELVGRFLNTLVKIHRPKTILEIGCANGYSTIWLAEAASKIGATIHAIDFSKPTLEQAKKNLREVGMDKQVTFYFGDALEVIPNIENPRTFDFVFVDGQKASYADFWKVVKTRLNPHAVVIFDNMLAFPEKTSPFKALIEKVSGFDQLLLPMDEDDSILILSKDSEAGIKLIADC